MSEAWIDASSDGLLQAPRGALNPLDVLSGRERDVLALVAEGWSNAGIAERLHVTERTVEAHVSRMFQKLDLVEDPSANRRVQAALAFLRQGSRD